MARTDEMMRMLIRFATLRKLGRRMPITMTITTRTREMAYLLANSRTFVRETRARDATLVLATE
jgi:hypothetical protein